MIRLKGHLLCTNSQDIDLILTHLPEHTRLSRAEAGCLSFEVTQSDDPMIWEVMETFRTRADFDAHQLRTRDSEWFRQTQTIARAYRVEEIAD
jgi:quinol monooxygenase YgiN